MMDRHSVFRWMLLEKPFQQQRREVTWFRGLLLSEEDKDDRTWRAGGVSGEGDIEGRLVAQRGRIDPSAEK